MPLLRPKNTPQMIVIFPDEDIAFDAYCFLQNHGISPENMVLVGEGFSSPEYLSCLRPRGQIARQTAWAGMWSGFRVGLLIALVIAVVSIYVMATVWLVTIGLMVAILATTTILAGIGGWLFGFFHRSHVSTRCRSYLRQGQYLLLLEGSESLIRQGREILHSYGSRYDF